MTSTNDGKDVKSNQTCGQKGKSYYIELYKSLETRLSGECGLTERTVHVCEAWRRVHSLCLHSAPATHPHLLSWLQRHTARTILHTKWSKEEQDSLEEAIDAFIEETKTGRACKDGVSPPWETQLLQRGQWFKRVLSNPWGHPVLRLLLDPKGPPPTDDEILEWLKEERGVMFVTRLRQLATSKCGDLAVLLVTAVMDRVRASTVLVPDNEQSEEPKDKPKPPSEKPSFADTLTAEAGFTVDVWELLTDIEFVLLHKGDSRSKCIDLAKQTPLRNGYQLVERLQGRLDTSPREKKLWKNAKDVATLIAQVVIARCMVVPVCSNVTRTALYCCTRSLVRLLPAGKLESAAAALAAPAATARHLHTLAAATLAQCGSEMKPFVCELYVRAITAGMNELERLKLNTEKETDARQQEQTLSSWFTQLGNLLSTSSRLRCECTLTAFSVHPSPAMYVCIQQAPELPCLAVEQDVKEETTSEFGSWATDSRTQSNLVKTSETLNLKQMQHQANVLSTAILSEGEALGLSPELCQDLAVLLSGPRVKTLSWDMDRNLLLENCRTYMERTHGGTRALTTELKYLNLDPRSYQHLPEEDDAENDAFYGIEKGYEHLVEVQEQEEIWQDAYSDPERTDSVSSINSDIVPLKTTVRKKKKKPPVLSSEEDSDPLSLVAEAKRNEKKKERPHSKERSKERKDKKKSKPKDGTEKKESSRESRKEESKEKKEKKPRKKKIKEEVPFVDHKPGSLSSLIGLKVAKVKIPEGKYKRNSETKVSAPCITDSDYDSQGKSSLASLNSEGNDPDVLFDGLYNMEDYKSPEKGDPLADRSTYTSSELSVANGRVAINTATSLGRTDNRYKLQTSRSNINRPKQDLNTSKNAAIREEVKKSITKLIEFRRQKSLLEETQIFKSIGSSPVTSYSDKSISPKPSPIVRPNSVNSSPLLKSPKAIVRPEFPEPAVISPKAVEVPEIPKAYINKKQIESLKELKQGVDMLLHSKNPVIQYANKQQPPTCESSFQQYVQQRQQIYTHNPYFPISQNRSSASVIHSSQEEPAKEVQRNFEDFLRDLQESINAGTGANTKANTPKNAPARKEVKPISRVQPVIPNFPKTEPGTSSQCAKPTTQSSKKVDSQLNTFARLSYMHKNKQSDVKFNKQALDLSNQEQQQILARCIEDQKSAKIKYLQSRGDISILRVGNNAHSLLKDDSQVVIRKVDKPTSFALDHPVLSNMLHGNHTPAAKQQPRNETQVRSVPYQPEKPIAKHTALSEKDQNELLLLLRQQNKLNTSVSYSSSDVNKIVSSQYLKNDGASNSTPVNHNPVTSVNNSVIMPTEFKNSNVQQYEGCRVRTVHCDSIPDTHTKSMDCKSGKISKTTTSKKINVTLSKVQNVTPCENQEMNASSVQTYGSQDNVLQKPNIAKKATKTGTIKKPNITLTKVPNATCQSPQTSSNLATTIRPQENMFQPQVEPQDWESVMDALLSHKTPSLGPNALDVALKKDSFAKTALRNQRIVRKKELMVDENQPHKQGQSTQQDAVTSTHTNVTPAHLNVNPEQSAVTDLSTKKLMKKGDTQTVRVEPSKRISSVQKPQPCEALKEKDPFISGIPNSDYDLLDELMDDELRKEIGELSSDEDNYRAPEVGSTKVIKTVPLGKCTNVIKNLPPQAVQSVGSRCSSSSSVQNIRESIIQTSKRAVTKTYEAPKNQHAKKSTVQTTNIANTIPKEADKPKILENVTLPCSKIKAPVANIHSQAQSSDEPTCNVVNQNINRSHAKLVDARNMLITSTPVEAQSSSIAQSIPIVQSRPVAPKVMVIGSEVLYDPFAVAAIQTPIVPGLCNVNQTPYVALSTTPSITVYQTTQFAPPIINPVIIGNAMTVAAAERLPDATSVPDTTSIPSLQQAQAISSQMDISKPPEIMQDCAKSSLEILRNGRSNTDVTNDSNFEPKCIAAHDIIPLEVSKSEIDTNTNLDINFNKNGDRKVLSEVQDKQAINLPEKVEPKATKNQKHSSESEMKKEIVKDQEKPEIGIKSQQQSKILENITKQEDLGRIMMKRLAILDRTTLHRSSAPPIPLEYIPLITSKQKILTGQKTNPSITTPTSNTEICNETTADKNITADNVLNNKVVHKQDNLSNENSKENDNKTTQCRRILLRSSNDLKVMTVTSNQQDQRNPVGRKTKVRLKSETKKLDNEVKRKSITDDKSADEKDSPKRTSKRILDKKRNSLKKVENDDTVNQAPNQTNKKNEKVLKTTKQAADVIKDDKEQIAEVKNDNIVLSTNKTTDQKEIPLLKSKAKTNEASNPTQNTDNFGMIDIEDALLGSKIPKIAQSDAQPEEQSINETENSEESVRPRPARKKRKPRKFSEDENVNTSSNNLNETNDKIETDLEKAVNHTDCVPSSDTESGKTGVTISIIRNKKGSGKPQFKIIDGKPKPNLETRQTRGKNVNRNMEPPATTELKKINVADKVIGTTNNSDVGVMKSKTETGIKINDLKKSKPELTIRSARANSTNKNQFSVLSVPIKNAEKLPEILKNSGISLQENPVCNLAANPVSANKSHNLPATSNVKSVSMINDTGIKYSQSTIQTKRSKSKESVNVTNQIDMNTKTMGDVVSPQTDSIIKIPFKKPCATTSVVVPPTSTLKMVNVKKDVMPLTSTLNSESGPSKVNMDASTPKINTQSVASRDLVSAKTNTLLPQNNVLKSSSVITNNTPQHTAKETITKSENPVTARDSFAELKEKIIIEELPSPPDNPTKKCVRIKLPNGKTFKATIFGKMHVSFESIFSDPALKATLLTNLNDTKRYTVNVKQVSTAAKNDPHKIVDARIEEVNVQARDVQPIETVNLLSDDEEDNDNTKKTQSFKTEFGEYKIVAINEIDLQNHQKKLNQTCFVKLMKMMQSKSSSHSEVIPRLQHSNSDNKLGVDEVVNNGVLDKIRTVMDAVDKQIVEIDKLNDLPSSSSNNHVAKVAICPIVKDDDTKDDRESTIINNQTETNVRSPIVLDDEKEDHSTTLNNQNDDSESCPLVKDGENNDDLTTPFNNQTDICVERHIVLDDKINVEHINVLNDQSAKSTNRAFTSDNDKDDLTKALDIPAEKDSSCTTLTDIDIKDGPDFIDASCPIETENEKNKGLKMIFNHQIDKDANCRVVSIKYDDSKENVTTPKEQTEPIVLDENGKNYISTALYNQADNNVSSSNVTYDKNKSDLITIMNNQPEVDASCPIVTEEDKNEDIITTSNNLIEKYTSCPVVNDDDNGKDNFTTTSTNQTDSVLLDDDAKDSTKALDNQTDKDLNDPIVKEEEYKHDLTTALNNQTDKDSSCPIVLDDDNNEDDTAKTLHEAFDDKSHLTTSLRNQTEDPSCPIVLDDDNDEDDTAKTLNEVFDDKSHLTTSLRNQTYKDTSCRLDDDKKDSVTTPMPNPIPRVITEVIEIDDSSNDSVGLINSSIAEIEETLRKEIANILKKPLPETLKETVKKPDEDIDELKMLLLKDLGVVTPNVENKQGIAECVVDPIVVIDNDDEETPHIKTKKCFVRLENCDELAEEFEKKRIMKQSDLDIQQYDISFDPMDKSLAEELTAEYSESDLPCSSVTETNFKMGFGEGSDRVIQNLEDVGDDSKFSAATLSDVKQPQPFLLSEDYENNQEETSKKTREDQIKQLRRYITYIQMRDKVRSFFRKTTVELKYDLMKKQEKQQSTTLSDGKELTGFPFDLYNATDFLELPPADVFVQVVQVGQLPVSAAAQNPVTCDPRVTQVSDASPSQCSVDNSPQDDSQPSIKTEYTELTTADLTNLPLVQEYAQHNQTLPMESQEETIPMSDENIPIETEIKSVVKIELMEETEVKEEQRENYDNNGSPSVENRYVNTVDYSFDTNAANATPAMESEQEFQAIYNSSEKQNVTETYATHQQQQQQPKQQNGTPEKTDQIAHAMNAAGITTISETMTNTTRAQALVNILSQKLRQGSVSTSQSSTNNYTKTTSINAMSLQQALAQILPPPLNQTNANENNQQNQNSSVTPQVLHIVQGKNASGSQITLVDNSQQSVINGPNATSVLHIVQNKSGTTGATSNGAATQQTNSFGGLSLVDAGIQQGGNQLLHIVNTGNQKNNNATGQLLKRVNLLTNLANVQGSNEQKMVQFVCKSADGKAIQLNAPHQRSMVLRLQPIENPNVPTTPKSVENQTNQDLSPTSNSTTSLGGKDNAASQQEIKSRSVYEENYAKFIQNSSTKTTIPEKSTSLPKFNQAFGKPVFQDGSQKQNEINSNNSHLSVNTNSEGSECQSSDNAINLDHIGQISSPPLLLRKSPAQTSQSQANLVQQIKQTITPMNIQTMHGGVIYTRQIPVNIGGGQTINLITVPSTELVDESGQKQQPVGTQNEIEPSIIKIVPQNQTASNSEISSEDGNAQMNVQNETNQNQQPQPQPVLTQMRIKLPMLSKTPQMVSGARVVRPSFFQIQRNVIGGNNQPVYQQLVLTAAPPLGQQTIRLPQTQTSRQIKVPTENQSSAESQMSSSTLEQLREFDMVLEQVKERSSVPPNSNSSTTFPKLHTSSTDTTDGSSASSTSTETTQQVLYSIGNNHQPLNVAYVNRKATVTTPTTSTFVRSPDSSGIVDSPTSSSHVQIPHTVTTDSSQSEPSTQAKPKVSSKSKSRPKASSNPPNNLKINTVPPKTSAQKPLEDEQTTQRILYILAEYKEQVENSPDKDKPAPRRRSNPPSNPSGSSKRKKSSSGSRRHGRDLSPIHGEDTCRTMGSEDSSCGTSQGDCNESCLESHSPQDSPRKVVRKLTFENETPPPQPRPQPQRNVIVADGQTITVARGTAGKPATAVLMPANYILPVSMVKGGQQIAIVTNRGPKLLTVGGGEGGATNALLLQRLIGPAGLKPVLARPGVRHVRLPTAALHNLQAFNLATATTVQPPDSTASPAPAPTPPELVDTRATSSPWTDRDCQDVKPERGSSPEGSEPWNLPSSGDPHDYTYEETVRADNLDRTVLVVQKKDGHRQHRLTHVSAAALRHKYAILEHELRLQKSLSEECEDLGVDSPSASELFPEAELLFAASPAHDHTQDQGHHSHTPQPTLLNQSGIPQPDIDDQIATDQLLTRGEMHDEQQDLQLGLEDVGMVGVGVGAGLPAALDAEEFARAHPNTTFHSEPTDDGEVQPFTIAGLKGRHITSTIFHSNRAPATVLMTAPQTTVISQATADGGSHNTVKYDIDNMINSLPSTNGNNINLSSVLVKDEGLTRFDSILNDSRELHLSNTASAIVHSAGNATQVIRRVCYDDDKRDNRFLMDEPDALIAGDDAKMIAEDSSRDATLESMAGDVDDDRSSPERHAELFWESNSASERSESRRPLDFSSDSEKCCKSPSYDETNSTDSSGVGTHMRLDSVIKDARGIERSGSADGSSADDTHPPLRTYPPKRTYHPLDGEVERSLSGKTRAGERSPDSLEVRRRASGRGVVKRGCHCCNGSPAPPRPKKSRQRKPTMDFTN
ncbi:hypothetical protein ABMA28_010928 [Loxostege sticticalis]|uniref:Uncharacterized protein n=1 Tax=Loxostege sticticalis TaxID=481309 RepID=A0ABD0S8M2_LOXSC